MAGEVTNGPAYEAITARAQVEEMPSLRREISPRNDLRALRHIRRTILALEPDIVHTHQSKAGLLGRLAAATITRRRRPAVVHSLSMASFGPGYPKSQSLLFENLEKITAPLVDRYLCVGHDLITTFAGIGIDRAKFTCVRSSQQLQPYFELARQRDLQQRNIRLVFVGALEERKGVAFLGELLSLLQRDPAIAGQDYVLAVAGEGSLRDQLEADAVSRGVTIELLGYCKNIPAVLSEADIFILPSHAEGLPQVLVQAAASNLPFASYPVHGTDELLAMGAHGTVAQTPDIQSLVDSIRQLIASQTNTQRLRPVPESANEREMSQAVDSFAEWDQSVVVDKISDAYTALVPDPNSTGQRNTTGTPTAEGHALPTPVGEPGRVR